MDVRELGLLSLLLLFWYIGNAAFRKKISAEARYLAGLLVMLIFLIPWRLELFTLDMPRFLVENYTQSTVIPIAEGKATDFFIEHIGKDASASIAENVFSFRWIWFVIYLFGVIFSIFFTLKRHFLFCRTLKRCSTVPSKELLWQEKMLCGKMNIKKQPKLLVCRGAIARTLGAPFTFGVIRRVIVMPSDLKGEAAEILLEHELHHCKHHDTVLRFLMVFLKAIYWYYLPIYFFTKALERVCEEACDERMTDGKNTAYRAAYGKLLIGFASKPAACSVSFSNAKEKLKHRIEALFFDSVRMEGYWFILLTMFLAVAFMSVGFEMRPNFNRQMTGSEYLQSVPKDSMENDLLSAFDAANRLDDLAYGLYYADSYGYSDIYNGNTAYENGIFYRNCLVSMLIVQLEDGTKSQTKVFSADRKRAETCVGIRVVYREKDGKKQYQTIEIMTERDLLSSYAKMLIPDFAMTGNWEKLLLATAETKHPDLLWFYEILMERTKS